VGNAANERAVWSLHGSVAKLSCGKLSGHIDASRPNAGMHHIAFDGVQQSIDLLCAYRPDIAAEKSWPLPIAESYVRGNDLVASYQATEEWPFSPQLYWRANSLRAVDGVLASMSLLVSVQTHLLDTIPQIAVVSQLPCNETLNISVSGGGKPTADRVDSSQTIPSTNEDCCVVSRFRNLPLSYVEIMPAGDFHAIRPRPGEKGMMFEWRLFAEFLEKGVIRRARVHTAIVPRENDIEIAAACCKAIDSLELPLTT
jgi:hypothetical protein